MNLDNSIIYFCKRIPDPSRADHRVSAGGDVTAAIGDGIATFLRTLSDRPPGEAMASFRYVYIPAAQGQPPQSRLFLETHLKTNDAASLHTLDIALTRGPLSVFYDFQNTPGTSFPWERMTVVCHIVRKCDTVPSLTDPRDHPQAMRQFLIMRPFSSRQQGPFVTLDKTFDAVNTPCLVDIIVEAVDMGGILENLASYGALVEELERPSAHGLIDEPDDPVFHGIPRSRTRPLHSVRSRPPSRDPLASDALRDIRLLSQSLSNRCLKYNIRVFAEDESTAKLLGSVVGDSCFDDGSFSLWTPASQHARIAEEIMSAQQVSPIYVPFLESLSPEGSSSQFAGLGPIANTASIEELHGLRILPIATGHATPRTIPTDTSPPEVDPSELLVLGHEIGYGNADAPLRSRPARGIRISDLLKHVLILGVPGTGKTSLCLQIVALLWSLWKIPSLIIECAKKEYRSLLMLQQHSSPALREFGRTVKFLSPGGCMPSTYRRNILDNPDATIDQRVQFVIHTFEAGMALSGPMIPILTESLYVLFEQFDRLGYAPIMDELILVIEDVLRSKCYGSELEADIRGALTARISPLLFGESGRIQRTSLNVPDTASLFRCPHILELNGIPYKQRPLYALDKLAEVMLYADRLPHKNGQTQLFVLLEEAPVIVPPSRGALASPDNPDTASFCSEFVKHILSVGRGVGIGVGISSQLVMSLDECIAKIPASTIVFRARDAAERDWISGSLLLSPMESDDLVRLCAGIAFLMTPGLHSACRIQTPNIKKEWGIEDPPHDDEILPFIVNSPSFRETMVARFLGEMGVFSDRLGTFEDEINSAQETLETLGKRCDAITQRLEKGESPDSVIEELKRASSELRAKDAALQNTNECLQKTFGLVVPAQLTEAVLGSEAEEEYVSLQTRWEQACRCATVLHESIQKVIASVEKLSKPERRNSHAKRA